ncbi:RHS repeat-associated core domain-containing protein [Aeromonas salmonicida]|uniref:RHS repeat-associated core domain-containing protein n=1 Tax=Aeromonas salmonicida TaxID=645 RepID=UPI002796B408|nr:RHS repeat-associated core domain-containing protein [Aeromonas salmonicida]MDQ1886276.1 RHS repeat-associated core domain-containing protein [Aeromonas salmonicida]
MDNLDNIIHEGQPQNTSRRSFMLRASVLATSGALLTLSPVGRAIADWVAGPGEMPETVGRLLLQGNCLAFNGERRDPVTGLYHLGQGYRAYNPRLMRFHVADSLSPFGEGGINPYAYCLGDPINAVDPTGHLSWQAGLGIGLGILGIIISIATLGMGIHAGMALNFAGVSLVTSSVLGVASGALGIASSALESSNPQLSAALGWASLGLGIASAAFGFGGAIAGRAAASRLNSFRGPRIQTVSGSYDLARGPYGGLRPYSNGNGSTIWLSKYRIRGSHINNLIINKVGVDSRKVILSGTHGSRNGLRGTGELDKAFYRADKAAFLKYPHTRVKNMSHYINNPEKLRSIVNSNNKHIIVGFCYGRNDLVIRRLLGLRSTVSLV